MAPCSSSSLALLSPTAAARRPQFARLPAYNPFVGTFHHAPSAGNRGAIYFSADIVGVDELEERKRLRQNPLTGIFHALPGYYDPLHGLEQFRRVCWSISRSDSNNSTHPSDGSSSRDLLASRRQSLEFLDLSVHQTTGSHSQHCRKRGDSQPSIREDPSINTTTSLSNVHAKRHRCNSAPEDGDGIYTLGSKQKKSVKPSSSPTNSTDTSDDEDRGYVSTGKGLYRRWQSKGYHPSVSSSNSCSSSSLPPSTSTANGEYRQSAPRVPVNPFVARRLHDDEILRSKALDRAAPRGLQACAGDSDGETDVLQFDIEFPKPYFIHEQAVTDQYLVCGEDELGDGSYAVVRPAIRHDNGTEVAIKQVHKRYLRTAEAKKALDREVEIHLRLQHRHIVVLFEVYETEDFLYLVMEKATHGTLKQYITFHRVLNETVASRLAQQLLRAVFHIHAHGVLHCDLKPDNVLLTDKKTSSGPHHGDIRDYDVQVCDFGLAMKVPDVRYYKSTGDVHKVPNTGVIGTSGYIAPEIMSKLPYGKPADMWSVGIIIFEMLTGYTPFYPPHACMTEKVDFSDFVWKKISPEARGFVASLLAQDPSKRLTAEQALAHQWFEGASVNL